MSTEPAPGYWTDPDLQAIADPDLIVFRNPLHVPGRPGALAELYRTRAEEVARIIEAAPGYAPTPLYALPRLGQAIGCAQLLYKDEGPRFGLGSFKAAGAAYAMIKEIERRLGETVDAERAFRGGYSDRLRDVVFATATSGNHGRGLAWAAQAVGARCIIYVPLECSPRRKAEMARRGAEIVETGVIYNPAMDRCRADCARNGWTLFADTSWPDYTAIPTDIMLGYAHIMREIGRQTDDFASISHVVIQGGVGAFAAGLIAGLSTLDPAAATKVLIVEPRSIAALQASARAGRPAAVAIERMSAMTGISNAEISTAAWPTVAERTFAFLGLRDEGVGPCIRFLARGGLDTLPIALGETGTAALTALISAMTPPFRPEIAATNRMGALVFGCEGVTDPDIYQRILEEGARFEASPAPQR